MNQKKLAGIRRLMALTRKEWYQLLRSTSSLLMGIVLPVILILLIGYGISLDVNHVATAIVLEDHSPTARQMMRFADGSPYIDPVYVNDRRTAEKWLTNHEVEAVLVVPTDFSSQLARKEAKLQLILNGSEAVTAMSAQRYIEAGVLSCAISQGTKGQVTAVNRVWFNDANTSTWFFVPGIIMLVLTISGVFLTSVVMAKEWEQGTFEAIFVTPARIIELILAKVIPYFCIAMLGFFLCLLAGVFLYDLPIRGSLVLIVGESMLYLVDALGLGLLISALTRSQFLACQVSLVVSFLPTIMLSGFLFDMHAQPEAIQVISHLFPTTYYLQLLKSLFLSGNYWPLLIENTAILIGYGVLFITLAWRYTQKKVNG